MGRPRFLASFDDGFFVARSGDELLLVEFTAWGVIVLLWGALLIAAGLSVAAGKSWARWFVVVSGRRS